MAQAEDKDPSEEEGPASDETVENRKVGVSHNNPKDCAEDEKVLGLDEPSTWMSRCPRRWFDSKGDNLGN